MAAGSGGRPRAAARGDELRASAPDVSVAQPARIWDYWLGGKDNFAADRAAGDRVLEAAPDAVKVARACRVFLARAVGYLSGDLGIRQFLDIGTGLPAADSIHEVAQNHAPESRVVYVDNNPAVMAHARARFTSRPEGSVACVDADARDTSMVLAAAAQTLDLSQPVAVMLLGVLPFIPDADDPWQITRQLTDAVPPGSFLAVSHGASDIRSREAAMVSSHYNEHSSVPLQLRTREEFTRFFDDLELAGPGVVTVGHWAPALRPGAWRRREQALPAYAALGRKPLSHS